MGKKNYSCESSDSCSLVSVTGISTNSSCSESSTSTSSSGSSSSTSLSSSSSSEVTYSDNSTSNTTSSSSSSSEPVNNCKSVSSELLESQYSNRCNKLVKKYNCAKSELLAITDIIVVLNFIKSKLSAVQPNINLRHVEKYNVLDNITWLECFIDTLFCVLRKNEAYKVIKVKDYKLKNDCDVVSNRTYLMRVKYETKEGESCKNIPLVFQWSQLTNNDAKSYKAVLDYVIHNIDEYIKGYQAAGTVPFLC
jgi:hypothetical protein